MFVKAALNSRLCEHLGVPETRLMCGFHGLLVGTFCNMNGLCVWQDTVFIHHCNWNMTVLIVSVCVADMLHEWTIGRLTICM